MGKKEKAVEVVLDTNVLLSALLFKGALSALVELWKTKRIVPVLSKETFEELRSALAYPKFRLIKDDIRTILEHEVLPYFEIVEVASPVRGVCKDPDDDKFIACAVAASVTYLVSGDKRLCEVGRYKSIKIITPTDFLRILDA